MNISRRQWITAAIAAVVAAALSVAVNLATEYKSNVVAWIAVGVITVGAAVSGAAISSFQSTAPTLTPGPVPPGPSQGGVSNSIGGNARKVVQAGSIDQVTVHNTRAGVVLVVGVLVLAAGAGGIALTRGAGTVAEADPSLDATKAPFTATAKVLDGMCDSLWITPQPPDAVVAALNSMMQSSASPPGWTQSSLGPGGAQVSGGEIQLLVQGTGKAEVSLTDVRVRITANRPPLRGTKVESPCGDAPPYRYLSADLDTSPVKIDAPFRADLAPNGTPERNLVPIRFPYTVSLSDGELFIVEANTVKCDCDWVLDIDWASGTRSGTVTVDNAGTPFRTSSDAEISARCVATTCDN